MKRPLIWVIVAVLVIGAGLAAWFLVLKPRFFPSAPAPATGPGTTTAPVAKPVLPDDYNSAVNLYVAGPDDANAAVNRVELTLAKAEVTRGDSKTFKIFEGGAKLIIQKGVSEKLLNELMPAGMYGTLALTFLPTGSIVAADGSAQTVFLPNRTITIGLTQDIPVSRTLTMLVHLDLAASRFGIQSDVPTYQLPATLTAETYLLGGIFRNTHAVGGLWELANPNLADEVKRDLNLEISSSKPALPGSPSFEPPTAPPEPQR